MSRTSGTNAACDRMCTYHGDDLAICTRAEGSSRFNVAHACSIHGFKDYRLLEYESGSHLHGYESDCQTGTISKFEELLGVLISDESSTGAEDSAEQS